MKENGVEGLDYLEEKDVIMEVKEGKITGFALVILKDEEDVDKALELDHKEIGKLALVGLESLLQKCAETLSIEISLN